MAGIIKPPMPRRPTPHALGRFRGTAMAIIKDCAAIAGKLWRIQAECQIERAETVVPIGVLGVPTTRYLGRHAGPGRNGGKSVAAIAAISWPTKTSGRTATRKRPSGGDIPKRMASIITSLSCRFPHWLAEIMAMSDGEPNPLVLRPGRSSANRLVSLGLAVVLVGTQLTWTAFLGWVLLYFSIQREVEVSPKSQASTSWKRPAISRSGDSATQSGARAHHVGGTVSLYGSVGIGRNGSALGYWATGHARAA